MTFRFPRILSLLAVLTLVTTLFAQEGEGGAQHPGEALRKARQAVSDEKLGEGKGSKWANMTPEQRLNASIRRDSRGQCRFVATCRPPKLMPGESGLLLITAILQGDAVLPAPLQMTMTSRVAPGAMEFGDLVARPAQRGVLAPGYLGRPVYENTAIMEVPVTMGNDAKLGSKQPVAVDLQFDIFDGKSAQIVGRFIERVMTDIEVGRHIDPAVVGLSSKPQPTLPTPVVNSTNEPVGATTDVDKPALPAALGGTAAAVPVVGANTSNTEAREPETNGGLPPTETDDGGFPGALVIGGGAFLLVILLLLMRKK